MEQWNGLFWLNISRRSLDTNPSAGCGPPSDVKLTKSELARFSGWDFSVRSHAACRFGLWIQYEVEKCIASPLHNERRAINCSFSQESPNEAFMTSGISHLLTFSFFSLSTIPLLSVSLSLLPFISSLRFSPLCLTWGLELASHTGKQKRPFPQSALSAFACPCSAHGEWISGASKFVIRTFGSEQTTTTKNPSIQLFCPRSSA